MSSEGKKCKQLGKKKSRMGIALENLVKLFHVASLITYVGKFPQIHILVL